jgi:hypothetical protein
VQRALRTQWHTELPAHVNCCRLLWKQARKRSTFASDTRRKPRLLVLQMQTFCSTLCVNRYLAAWFRVTLCAKRTLHSCHSTSLCQMQNRPTLLLWGSHFQNQWHLAAAAATTICRVIWRKALRLFRGTQHKKTLRVSYWLIYVWNSKYAPFFLCITLEVWSFLWPSPYTNQQASKQASKQTNKQTNMTHTHIYIYTLLHF